MLEDKVEANFCMYKRDKVFEKEAIFYIYFKSKFSDTKRGIVVYSIGYISFDKAFVEVGVDRLISVCHD